MNDLFNPIPWVWFFFSISGALSVVFYRVILKKLNQTTIPKKLFILTFFWYSSFICCGGAVYFYLQKIGSEVVAIAERDLPLIKVLTSVEANLFESAIFFERGVVAYLNKDQQHFAENQEALEKVVKYGFEHLEAAIKTTEKDILESVTQQEKQRFEQIHSELEKVVVGFKSVSGISLAILRSLQAGTPLSSKELVEVEKNSEHLVKKVKHLLVKFEEFTAQAALHAEHLEILAVQVLMSLFFSLLTLLTLWLLYVLKSIVSPIREVSKKLTVSAEKASGRAKICSSLSSNLSSASTQQASALQETSASCEEILAMVRNNTKQAESSENLSYEVKNTSLAGSKNLKDLVEAVEQITESNKKVNDLIHVIREIGDKTGVIEEIVFQTKLLSFNASVEAERAGEHGRGFAVVAQEVGILAQMSGKASLEISTMVGSSIDRAEKIIFESQEKIQLGAEKVKSVEALFRDIEDYSEKLATSSQNITKATREQLLGVEQINEALSHMETMIAQTSESAGDLESESSQMKEGSENVFVQTDRLKQMAGIS